jgi:hypothetical protein
MKFSRTGGGAVSAAARRLLERRLKEMLLEEAERAGLEPWRLAEWLYEEHGVRVRPDPRSVRRAVLSSPVTAQELAVFLMEEGVEVSEEKWLRILREQPIGGAVPRLPPPGGPGGALGGGEEEGRRAGGPPSPKGRGRGRKASTG